MAITETHRQPTLTGRQKAAVFLISMGPEASAQVMKQLSEEEIEAITLEIANVRRVEPEVRELVLGEFRDLTKAQLYIDQGGIAYAKEILEKALGSPRANEVMERLTATLQVRPFEFVRRSEPGQILNFIQNEHPQTIALIMAYLNPEQAGAVLSALPPDRQADIARRVAMMDTTSPDVIREIEEVLEERFAEFVTEGSARVGGVDTVVAVLNRVDRTTERTIMEALESADPALAEEIKKRMFVFDDLVLLDDRSLQRVLREIDLQNDLPLALRIASEDVKGLIRRNLSQRAQENLDESMAYLGPVRLRDVEEAQQRIVTVVRRLEEEGEIVVSRGGEDDVVV